MNSKQLILIALLAGGSQSLLAMDFESMLGGGAGKGIDGKVVREGMEALGSGVESMAREIQRMKDNRRYERERKIEQLRNDARDHRLSAEQKLEASHALSAMLAAEEKSSDMWDGVAAGVVGVYTNAAQAGVDVLKQHALAAEELKKEAVKAEMGRRATVENCKQVIAAATDPKNAKTVAMGVTLAVLGAYGTYKGLQILGTYAEKNLLETPPTLAQDTSMQTWSEQIGNWWNGIKPKAGNVSSVVLAPALADRIASIAQATTETVKNNDYFRNILLWGPPGTGKTMIAKQLAYQCGLQYIYFSGSSLLQFDKAKGLQILKDLFEQAKTAKTKWMIVIDEAEKFLGDRRDPNQDPKLRDLITLFLTYTGTESKDFVVVALTNLEELLDKAVRDRMDESIHIGRPELTERVGILNKYLTDITFAQEPAPQQSSLDRWRNGVKLAPKSVVRGDDVTDDYLKEVAQRMEGWSGRKISKFCIGLRSVGRIKGQNILTKDLIEWALAQKLEDIAKHKEEKAKRAAKAAQ